jgi:hypothetical protein
MLSGTKHEDRSVADSSMIRSAFDQRLIWPHKLRPEAISRSGLVFA